MDGKKKYFVILPRATQYTRQRGVNAECVNISTWQRGGMPSAADGHSANTNGLRRCQRALGCCLSSAIFTTFANCRCVGARQRFCLPSVYVLPIVFYGTLAVNLLIGECTIFCTRQTLKHSALMGFPVV